MRARLSVHVLSTALAACGGASDAPAPNQAPTPRIVSPAAGSLFSAAQSLTVTLDGSDAEDGTFASNGWVCVHHTTTSGGPHKRISRFTASTSDPDLAQAGSEVVLVDLPALSGATNHNGGALHFGVDGKLYMGVGDNASSGNSPSLGTPLGKLLRFNDAGGAFYADDGALGAPWRGNYFFADHVNRFFGVIDLANGNAAYAFGSVSGSPVDVLAAADGVLLVLTRSSIVRFSVP